MSSFVKIFFIIFSGFASVNFRTRTLIRVLVRQVDKKTAQVWLRLRKR